MNYILYNRKKNLRRAKIATMLNLVASGICMGVALSLFNNAHYLFAIINLILSLINALFYITTNKTNQKTKKEIEQDELNIQEIAKAENININIESNKEDE